MIHIVAVLKEGINKKDCDELIDKFGWSFIGDHKNRNLLLKDIERYNNANIWEEDIKDSLEWEILDRVVEDKKF